MYFNAMNNTKIPNLCIQIVADCPNFCIKTYKLLIQKCLNTKRYFVLFHFEHSTLSTTLKAPPFAALKFFTSSLHFWELKCRPTFKLNTSYITTMNLIYVKLKLFYLKTHLVTSFAIAKKGFNLSLNQAFQNLCNFSVKIKILYRKYNAYIHLCIIMRSLYEMKNSYYS